MRDTTDPALHEYLAAENDYSHAWFAARDTTVEAIFQEIRSRVQETDMSTPVAFGGWWYVTRTEEGMSYPTHHRGPTRESASSQTVLDENVEAAGHEYFDLGAFELSHDHTAVAWSYDVDGDERYTLRVRDLETGLDLGDEITGTSNAGVAWSADGAWLFYVRPDAQERPAEVWRHRIGAPPDGDVHVYTETDERFFAGVGTTRSGVWTVIHAGSKTSAEVRLLPADDPTGQPQTVFRRREDVEYLIDHWGDRFVMLTNEDAVDFRVLVAPVDGDLADPAAWTELVAHEPGRRVTGVEPFEHHLVVHEWAAAQPRLRILYRDGGQRVVDLGDQPHDVDLSSNPEWTTDLVRFGTQSMNVPPTLFDEHVTSGDRTLLRRVPTPNVDLDQYTSQRVWATASDGTRVPIDLVHHRDTALDGAAPGVLYGYGAYEAALAPWFSVARLSLLDRGFVWALAHPRGGGELGRQWYLDGKLLAKPNSISDMLACAEHLVSAAIVAPNRLAMRGGSAGGLLVGACLTKRPEMFAAVVAEVPFVDIVSTMSDPSLPLTVTEWEEWGDPRAEPFASCIESYSPYDNTAPAAYPAVYVTAGLTDPRVSVHEPAKWVARLRTMQTGEAPVLLRTEMDAGHGGPTGRYDAWRDEARTLAFLLATV